MGDPFGLSEAHEFRPALEGQVVIAQHDVGHLRGVVGAELFGHETGQVVTRRLVEPVGVEGQVEEILGEEFEGLDVADIGDPHLARLHVPGALHLFVDQGGMGGAQPQIVVRPAPVGEVIIDAGAARPPGLFGGGEATDIAVIVVRPHQGNVVRHFQAGVIGLLQFMIGDIDLGHLAGGLVVDLAQDVALQADDILQDGLAFRHGGRALHGAVVQAAQADGIDVVVAADLADALAPIVEYGLTVLGEVERAFFRFVPFAQVVAHHRFGVGRADDDGIGVGEWRIGGIAVEGCRDRVHGRPQGIGL